MSIWEGKVGFLVVAGFLFLIAIVLMYISLALEKKPTISKPLTAIAIAVTTVGVVFYYLFACDQLR